MKQYLMILENEDRIEKTICHAQNKKEARKITKKLYKDSDLKLTSCFELVVCFVEDIVKTDFSRACLNELKAEGINIGDEIHGILNRKNNTVDFTSNKTGIDCMLWLGITGKFSRFL